MVVAVEGNNVRDLHTSRINDCQSLAFVEEEGCASSWCYLYSAICKRLSGLHAESRRGLAGDVNALGTMNIALEQGK